MFSSHKMSGKELLSEKFLKEVEKNLGGISFDRVDTNNHRVYQNPSNRAKALAYTITATGGAELLLWVSVKGANLVRVEVNGNVIDSAGKGESQVDITAKQVAKQILKAIRADEKAEFKAKIDKRKISQLINDLDRDEQDKKRVVVLENLKKALTKGSGFLVVVDEDNKFHGGDGTFTDDKTQIFAYAPDEIESAREKASDGKRIVRI